MRVLVLGLLVLAACDDDVDLSGMYRVDEAVRSSPCGADMPRTDAPAYVRFTKQDLFGADYFAYEECSDEAGTDCDGPGLFGGFPEPIDDGWRSFSSFSSGGDGNCLLGITEKTALLKGSALVVEGSTRRQSGIDLPQAQCTPEEAEKRADDLPCFEHERLAATRL